MFTTQGTISWKVKKNLSIGSEQCPQNEKSGSRDHCNVKKPSQQNQFLAFCSELELLRSSCSILKLSIVSCPLYPTPLNLPSAHCYRLTVLLTMVAPNFYTLYVPVEHQTSHLGYFAPYTSIYPVQEDIHIGWTSCLSACVITLGPTFRRAPVLGLIFCSCHLKILNYLLNKEPCISLCTRPWKWCRWSFLQSMQAWDLTFDLPYMIVKELSRLILGQILFLLSHLSDQNIFKAESGLFERRRILFQGCLFPFY